MATAAEHIRQAEDLLAEIDRYPNPHSMTDVYLGRAQAHAMLALAITQMDANSSKNSDE